MCRYWDDDNTCRVFWKTSNPRDGGAVCKGVDPTCFIYKNLKAKEMALLDAKERDAILKKVLSKPRKGCTEGI